MMAACSNGISMRPDETVEPAHAGSPLRLSVRLISMVAAVVTDLALVSGLVRLAFSGSPFR